MSTLYSILSALSLINAIFKGPRYLTAFLARRQLRKATNRQIRKVKW